MTPNGDSSRKAPVMPDTTEAQAEDAWRRAVRAEEKADSITDHALEQYGLIMRELGALNRHTQQMTEVVREMRDRIDYGNDRPITFPDLEKVVQAELRHNSDRAKADLVRRVQGWAVKGVGKAVTGIVALAIMGAVGWLIRDMAGFQPVHTHSAVVAPAASR